MADDALKIVLAEFASSLAGLLSTLKPQETQEAQVQEGPLTKRALLELVSHEAIVLEAYKDSKGIWTWGIGVTDKSGHRVGRYKDNPQSLKRVIEIFKWLVEKNYLPDVLEAFKGHTLSENELAAALSFHYNTGAIKKASWVKSFMKGDVSRAKGEFLNYRKPVEILERRKKERDLFFNGTWSNNGKATIYEVNKPSYTPKWSSAKAVDIMGEL